MTQSTPTITALGQRVDASGLPALGVLEGWLLRFWQFACDHAERRGRRVPYY